jgi:catechol 2,3-dioxygenase-like lactoylglutathione lyase family enzyme
MAERGESHESNRCQHDPTSNAQPATVGMKLEVVVIPVSDMERAKVFYQSLGWRLDATPPGIVQFTPPRLRLLGPIRRESHDSSPRFCPGALADRLESASCSGQDAAAGIKVNEVYHIGANGKANGLHPERLSYRSFASFQDRYGNHWVLQEITTRLPGRVDAATTWFGSASDLVNALQRAAVAHGEHEKRTGGHDENWPAWYADYMVAEQAGAQLPT